MNWSKDSTERPIFGGKPSPLSKGRKWRWQAGYCTPNTDMYEANLPPPPPRNFRMGHDFGAEAQKFGAVGAVIEILGQIYEKVA